MKHRATTLPHILPVLIVDKVGDTPLSYVTTPYGNSIHTATWLIFIRLWTGSISRAKWALVLTSAIAIPLIVLGALFLMPRSVSYSFARSDNCFFNPVFLPKTVKNTDAKNLKVAHQPSLSIGSLPIFSKKTCVSLSAIPDQTDSLFKLTTPIGLKKSVSVVIATLPNMSFVGDKKEPVAHDQDLSFKLDSNDSTFSYAILAGEKQGACEAQSSTLSCPLKDLNLQQGQSYTYVIERRLGTSSAPAFTGSLRLLDPLKFSAGTIQPDQIVYEKVKTIEIVSSKKVAEVGEVILQDESGAKYSLVTKPSTTGILITLEKELARNGNYKLSISGATAEDTAFLQEMYELKFKTSDGPKVQGVNVGSYNISTQSKIVVTFDIDLNTSQDVSSFVTLRAGDSIFNANTSVSGSKVTLQPTSSLPSCTLISVFVADGIQSVHGVEGNSAWNTKFRTTCQVSWSIGTSVQGRSITAYKFGSGSQKVLFVGGMHGNERSSVSTLVSWVEELERNYSQISADKTIVIIPNHNPDAYALDSRLNANAVDLNRNFPSLDWVSGVYFPANSFLESGGGTQPLSEPESLALSQYVESFNPNFVLTYHAKASAVFSNGAGNSGQLAKLYSDNSGFAQYDDSSEDAVFAYETTGEFETWLRDKRATPALLIELATMSSNEFTRQKSAMWAMVK